MEDRWLAKEQAVSQGPNITGRATKVPKVTGGLVLMVGRWWDAGEANVFKDVHVPHGPDHLGLLEGNRV